jgi:putative flippase GtrA
MKFINLEFIRFVLIGLVNTGLTYVLYLLLLFVVPYTIAYSISYIAGIFLSYFLNSKFVFKTKLQLSKALQFPLVYIVQYLLGLVLIYVLVDLFNFNKTIVPILIVIISMPITFVLSKFIIKGKLK